MRFSASVVVWALAIFMAAAPLWSLAQSSKTMPRVGVIDNVAPLDQIERDAGSLSFKAELIRLGWMPGRNVEILWRSQEGDPARIPNILDDLLRRDVDVLVLGSNYIAQEAQKKSRTVGIVTTAALDPVGTGLAIDLRRPGGNITGVIVTPDAGLQGKRLAFLREISPRLSRLAVLSWDHPVAYTAANIESKAAFERVAQGLGITLLHYRIKNAEQTEAALVDAKQNRADAVFVFGGSIFEVPAVIATLNAQSEKQRMPVMHATLSVVEAGGLIAFGRKAHSGLARAAHFVDRILKGAKPGDLPFEQLGNRSLHVNKKAAKAIGLTIPASILMQADKVIE